MAMYLNLRRVMGGSQNSFTTLLRRTYNNNNNNMIIQSRNVFCSCGSAIPKTHTDFLHRFGFIADSRRGFAKGRKSKDDSAGDTVQVAHDIGPVVKKSAASQMDEALAALSRELTKLRTGRASAGILDHIIVEYDGVKMALNRLAVVAVLDPKTLSVNPYDPNTLSALEKAIVSSPLGLNPRKDGERLIAAIPPLTKEHMQAICKVVTKSCEDVKQSIRRARQKALDTIKKEGSSISKDAVKRLEKEVDELTKKFVKSAEDICKAKEKEITSG